MSVDQDNTGQLIVVVKDSAILLNVFCAFRGGLLLNGPTWRSWAVFSRGAWLCCQPHNNIQRELIYVSIFLRSVCGGLINASPVCALNGHFRCFLLENSFERALYFKEGDLATFWGKRKPIKDVPPWFGAIGFQQVSREFCLTHFKPLPRPAPPFWPASTTLIRSGHRRTIG